MPEALRRVVFFASAAFILLAPGYKQFAPRAPSYSVRWDMFNNRGLDVYEARFESQDESGNRVSLDRFSLLGYSNPFKAPNNVRLFKLESEVWSTARSLCRALGPNKPVFMTVRSAARTGWTMVDDGTVDACTRRPPTGRAVAPSNDEDSQ